ncbi:MAG: hypothetical protein N2749_00935 [Clostridia bacterium]|nr:hypothetical protein [Clostridia bacterium]
MNILSKVKSITKKVFDKEKLFIAGCKIMLECIIPVTRVAGYTFLQTHICLV